ncbi:transglutaminase TgpA family protein [Streptomyces sp. TP-A0874]|uniref:transglutaminase TgpA family protein n=1 Tax=Streptomyces sp. TP-A0874 TaxID=549819 RepID=UPI000853EED0|nr:DUF3488 and transglutaminase-like domain-containing protein [Streptomyces sp. TP-A0874]
MSGPGRLALCAALATLLTACSLLPLVEPVGWIVQATITLAVVSGAGVVARRVPLPRPLTVAAQALVALLLLTLLFARGQALGGLLPGPSALAELGRLLGQGGDDVRQYAIPAPVTPGIRLMLVGGVLLIGLIVDSLAVTYRTVAPAGLPLLALYSVATGLSQSGASWLWFVTSAAGFLLLLLAEGRDRLSRWGPVLSGPSRSASRLGAGLGERRHWSFAPARTGRRIGAAVLGVALLVPALVPSLGSGVLNAPKRGSGEGPGSGTISAVNPLVSLQNSLNQPENREVLRYRTDAPSARDLYLRIVALDRFDGDSWKSSERPVSAVPPRLPDPSGLSEDVSTSTVVTSVSAADWYRQDWLPLPYPATKVEVDGRWRFEPEGRTLVGDRGQTTRGARYRVSSLLLEPTAEQLREARPAPKRLQREYTSVPDSLPKVVARTARRVTSGASGPYEQAVRLQDWFASDGGFSYDTEVASGTGPAAIARFLKEKEGFCVHFAFSMAAMARTLDIPARVAVGFTPGSAEYDGSVSVGLRDAHAWPELYFEGIGWLRFEPTPSRGTVPDYAVGDNPTVGGSDPDEPRVRDSAAPPQSPADSDRCSPQMRGAELCGAGTEDGGSATPTGGGSSLAPALGLAALALLLAASVTPVLWRSWVRRRRFGDRGEGEPDGASPTLALWRELIDSAWDYGILPDDSQTPRQAAERVVSAGGLVGPPAESAHRVARAVEQVLYAPKPRAAPGLAEDVRRVRTGLSARASGWRRFRARFAAPSTVRLLWSCSRRWGALTERLSPARWTGLLRRGPSSP